MSEPPSYPGTPRWVKVSGILVGILALVILLVIVTGIGGPHGPGRHTLFGDGIAGNGSLDGDRR